MIKTGLKIVLLSHLIEMCHRVSTIEFNKIYKATTRDHPDGESKIQIEKSSYAASGFICSCSSFSF